MDDDIGYYFFPSPLEAEDAVQENALRELEGKAPRTFRVNRVQYREMGYGLYLPGDAPDLFSDNRSVSLDVIEKLTKWTLEQDDTIQDAVFDYLESPSDVGFKVIMALLGLQPRHYGLPYSETTLTALILRSLPTTIDKLYELARREHVAKRPEANVRQVLRRFTRSGKVILIGEVYHGKG